MSNFQYLSWLSGIAKQASDISTRQQKYSRATGKKFKLSSKDIRTLGNLKQQVEKSNPLSNIKATEELKNQALKISKSYTDYVSKQQSTKNTVDKLSVLRDLTSGVYNATPGQIIMGWKKPTKPRRGRRGRRDRRGVPQYGWTNKGNTFNTELDGGSSGLERMFSQYGVNQQVQQTTAPNLRQVSTTTTYKYIEKNKALSLLSDKTLSTKIRKNYRAIYSKDQLDYLNKVLTNPLLEKDLYTSVGNTQYLKIGMLHQAIGKLLNPNASSEIKNSGIWLGKGGSQTSFLGGVYQVNPWSIYVNNYKDTFFQGDSNYQKTKTTGIKEQVLLESFLKKGGILSGINLSEYNKWIAESTKQQKLIDSSLNEYLKTGGSALSSRTWEGHIPSNPNYINTAYGGISGHYGKITNIKGPSNTYSGYVSRARNHAILYGKAQESAYLALQKAILDQEQKTKDITAARTQTISNISKLTEQNKAKTAIGKTLEQAKTEALKKRLSTSGGASSYKASPTQSTQRPL
jgi:hypothetical protein